ncbi:MAG: nicotinamide-nucleotide amidohydrolase family protein [Gammaproteobacteria bacterium]|jgi:nicotinamide-nucleotide amidase|nr:nicotinamide-nucleotide amidohydrolase family protein [Gammaproteobacteria bacterium]MBU0770296.1 nicotinamide-nucleotide amidohydrolase family protein [Gammaproteobacteria bacterium]MBU0857238.1 nicotinamide-nucleotide amidohydrolase family protein [Gammaproteobacteria bacterium]MBU1847913.1 nicotinamide-nucleotide amidohydrolase family protein [Gammaproteobacteria bacterium]
MDDALRQLASEVGTALRNTGAVLVTAESCTGGGVARAITAVPGSSAWFDSGFVTYSNASKQRMLGVSAGTLATHGAVSEAVALEMARGALHASGATAALSVTGIAGPDGAVAGKPVGTVCFGWALADGTQRCETRHFGGDRDAVREQSVRHTLAVLKALLRAQPGNPVAKTVP